MGDAARRLSAAGLHARAHELLAESEHVAEKISQPELRAEALENLYALMRQTAQAA